MDLQQGSCEMGGLSVDSVSVALALGRCSASLTTPHLGSNLAGGWTQPPSAHTKSRAPAPCAGSRVWKGDEKKGLSDENTPATCHTVPHRQGQGSLPRPWDRCQPWLEGVWLPRG